MSANESRKRERNLGALKYERDGQWAREREGESAEFSSKIERENASAEGFC
jgi:hypothetical protein